jgi:hypothetical protein
LQSNFSVQFANSVRSVLQRPLFVLYAIISFVREYFWRLFALGGLHVWLIKVDVEFHSPGLILPLFIDTTMDDLDHLSQAGKHLHPDL